MKKSIVLFFLVAQSTLHAQKKYLDEHYVNSGAYSLNTNCGIGEIFILPIDRTAEAFKEKPVIESFFMAYPNPVSDILYLSSSVKLTEVSLFSLDGKLVKSQDVSKEPFLNLENIAGGLYLLIAKNAEFLPTKILKN
ncbi:T9SS type A sorting domain-containing protein [Flavobacterium lindanitolerans]|uniref:T9SS type A sorting domain-containing protein n=1 Tax=Flavobacterium lindanitolerans TaxID=428988 RepID=UPI0031D55EFB